MSQSVRPPLRPGKLPRAKRDLMDGREKEIAYGCLVVFGILLVLFFVTLPDVRQVAKAAPGNSIQIFDRQDQLVVTIDGDEEREFTPLSAIPKTVQQALISAEDHTFYTHNGLSLRGIMRAFLNNAEAGRVKEGGSTVTQQLAKNLFFESPDRSVIRKIREAVLAVEIEKAYSKDQILEMYLNQVYFGRGAYGIERAARRYFGKDSRSLKLHEAAFLTGLLKAPSRLGDPKYAEEAKERQHLVLDEMRELKYITAEQAESAKKATLAFNRSNGRMTKFPYYMSAVQEFLKKTFDANRLENGGLRVYTNLDQAAQKLAERTVAQRVRAGGGGMNQAALVSVLVEDGSVVALVGGAGDYWKHQWNSAINPHTMGSSFKPFIYLTAFMQGKLTPDSILDDSPIVIPQTGAPDWMPKNFDGEYYGPMTVREALALSRNICAVRAALSAGIGNVIATARQAGIQSDLIPTPALSLGASAASPLEMAGAYATIARGGTYIEPQIVRRVEARDGFKKEFGVFPQKVFPDSPVRALISCMESVVKEGTGVLARLPDRPVAGKTGTSDEARDLWFVGFTPHMVTAVWGGNDQHRSLGGLTGGTVLTGIWKAYNQQYYRTHKVPKGTFYTEQRSNDNLWDQLLRKPVEETEEPTETEAPETVMPPQSSEGEEQQQSEGLPGMPEPGRVRHPMRPSQNDPFAPRNYQDEAPEEEQQGPQPAGPFGQFSAPENPFGSPQGPRQSRESEQDHAPMPAPDPDRLPLPAPDRGTQTQPEPAPAPAPSPNRYDGILREEAEPIE